MITPGSQDFTGYVGSTFDTIITVYPSADAFFTWEGAWDPTVNYSVGEVVIGTDNQAYDAIKANVNVNPIGGAAGNWSTPIVPMNLNGWSGTITLAPNAPNEYTQTPTLTTPVIIQGLQGTISFKFTPLQTGVMTPGTLHSWITMNSPTGDVYYYLNGTFTWVSP